MSVCTFATLPFAQVIATNLGEELSTGRLIVVWLLTVGLVLGLVVGVARRRPHATGPIAVGMSVFLLLFFNFPAVSGVLESLGVAESWHAAGWVLVALAIGTPLVVLGRRRGVQLYMAILGTALLAMPMLQILMYQPPRTEQPTASAVPAPATVAGTRPNVYFFLVDAYARPDVINELTGVDVSPFVEWLEDHDFSVSDQALANYSTTFLSLSSTLEMTYLADEHTQIDRGASFYRYIRGDNAVVKAMQRLGYHYVHAFPGVFKNSRCSGVEDLCIGRSQLLLDDTDLALLESTPIWPLVPTGSRSQLLARNSDPRYVTGQLLRHMQGDAPYFLFAHLLNPHPPYLRTAECELRDIEWSLENWGKGKTRQDYANAVQCLNTQLRTAVDAILETDPDPVIIIQGDHGFGRTDDWGGVSLGDPMAKQRLSILSAIRMPSSCDIAMPEDLTPVNTFRLVLACLDQAPPDLLANRHYGVTYGNEEVHRLVP